MSLTAWDNAIAIGWIRRLFGRGKAPTVIRGAGVMVPKGATREERLDALRLTMRLADEAAGIEVDHGAIESRAKQRFAALETLNAGDVDAKPDEA
jgi:hypothetical protein